MKTVSIIILAIVGLVGFSGFITFMVLASNKRESICSLYSTSCNVTGDGLWHPVDATYFSAECEYNGPKPSSEFGWFIVDCYYNPTVEECPTGLCKLNEKEESKYWNLLGASFVFAGAILGTIIVAITVSDHEQNKQQQEYIADLRRSFYGRFSSSMRAATDEETAVSSSGSSESSSEEISVRSSSGSSESSSEE
jgi:hypothetical protein